MRASIFRGVTLASVLSVSLCGCNAIGQQIGSGAVTGALTQVEQDVQAFTTNLCAYVPTVETVAEIFAANNPAYQTVAAIGDAICAAVSSPVVGAKTVRKRLGTHTVAGVTVNGHFVK